MGPKTAVQGIVALQAPAFLHYLWRLYASCMIRANRSMPFKSMNSWIHSLGAPDIWVRSSTYKGKESQAAMGAIGMESKERGYTAAASASTGSTAPPYHVGLGNGVPRLLQQRCKPVRVPVLPHLLGLEWTITAKAVECKKKKKKKQKKKKKKKKQRRKEAAGGRGEL